MNEELKHVLELNAGDAQPPSSELPWARGDRRSIFRGKGGNRLHPALQKWYEQQHERVICKLRLKIDMPKEDTKIVMRPRGGLNVARTEVSIIMSAVMTAARVTKEEAKADTSCANAQQNIIVVSTPDERRATLYSKVKALNIGGRTYEVSAYRTAPDSMVKGVIRGIAVDDTPEETAENIVKPCNPLVVEAHRIGNTATLIVLFAGQKVPNYVKYGSILVRCWLYRKYFDVCRQCGKVGHRRDVCPNPNTRVSFSCGIVNPSEDHKRECKRKSKFCEGKHPMGERECKNKYKMPYVVKKRQWERKMEAMQQQPDPESFPPLRAPSAERPRGKSRQRDSSRKRDNSKGGRSASRHRPSQSRERVAWADALKANMAEKRQPPAQNAAKKIQEENGVVKALRDENEKLKRRIAEQEATIKEIKEKLTTLMAMQQQQQLLPKPAQDWKQEEITEDDPEVEVDPRATTAAGQAPNRRAIEGDKERKIMERIEKQDDRLDRLEATSKVTNERLIALAQTVQHMTTNIQSTIQNMMAQMQAQLQTQIQAQIQGMEAQTIAKLQQSWTGQHVQQHPYSQ
ncbi:uncharacterized protein LOC142586077 [Dermacentor variabilis]|uniref:uncharacterized protein LOC142586077 n=1 Tax=Dermacentor variabilis TaxID=34621 RepID=UPI003F5B109C